ncbi:MAG: crossover junction endodeoxyribonuclease RuvC [Alphaproteobacteria bacterium]|nr:crossover junction endodeoxyribonuclease RuvC [Alphaproteobacteria bacterium]
MVLLGLDPGLRNTGWGIVEANGNRLRYIADGVIRSDGRLSLALRLAQLHEGVVAVIASHHPDEAAVEETFVNMNPVSTLKLGQARGAVILAPALAAIPVSEYKPNQIKKAVVGAGHAAKEQVAMMVRMLLPGCLAATADAADALAVAICHAHLRATSQRLAAAVVGRRGAAP